MLIPGFFWSPGEVAGGAGLAMGGSPGVTFPSREGPGGSFSPRGGPRGVLGILENHMGIRKMCHDSSTRPQFCSDKIRDAYPGDPDKPRRYLETPGIHFLFSEIHLARTKLGFEYASLLLPEKFPRISPWSPPPPPGGGLRPPPGRSRGVPDWRGGVPGGHFWQRGVTRMAEMRKPL